MISSREIDNLKLQLTHAEETKEARDETKEQEVKSKDKQSRKYLAEIEEKVK